MKKNKTKKNPFFPSWKRIVFVNGLLSLKSGLHEALRPLRIATLLHVCPITGTDEPPSSTSFTKLSFSACTVVTFPRMLTSATVLRIQSTTDSKSTKLKSGCCLSRCSSAAKVSSWFFRMEPVQQWEEFQRVKWDAIWRQADPFQHSGTERLYCRSSGKECEEKASKYKYQGIRLLLHVESQYRHLPWQSPNIFYINGCW